MGAIMFGVISDEASKHHLIKRTTNLCLLLVPVHRSNQKLLLYKALAALYMHETQKIFKIFNSNVRAKR